MTVTVVLEFEDVDEFHEALSDAGGVYHNGSPLHVRFEEVEGVFARRSDGYTVEHEGGEKFTVGASGGAEIVDAY